MRRSSDAIELYVRVAGKTLSLPDFLEGCAIRLRATSPLGGSYPSDTHEALMGEAIDTFLRGGVGALRSERVENVWLHFGLSITDSFPRLSRALLQEACDRLKEGAQNFFFMNKPPGIRIRFEVPRFRVEEVHAASARVLNQWRDRGFLDHWRQGFYEPEAFLFGGGRSMTYVHRLFTLDSLTWLDLHSIPISYPRWAVSFCMLRSLFENLEIYRWEDADVWNRIRTKLGREVPSKLKTKFGPAIKQVGEDLASFWNSPRRCIDQLPSRVAEVLERYESAAAPVAREWVDQYFNTEHAVVGRREAAAYYAIFHWNRAAFSVPLQSLLTNGLLSPLGRDE